jgi:hypothetical protein
MTTRRAGLAAGVLAAAAVLAGCGHAGPTELTAEEASALPTRLVVYDLVETPDGLRVSPQPAITKRVPDRLRLRAAVQALMNHRPGAGHSSLWRGVCRPGQSVREVRDTGDLVTVVLEDFPAGDGGHATCDLSTEGWMGERQQVAWTIHDELGRAVPVRVIHPDGYELMPATTAVDRWRQATSSPTNSPRA